MGKNRKNNSGKTPDAFDFSTLSPNVSNKVPPTYTGIFDRSSGSSSGIGSSGLASSSISTPTAPVSMSSGTSGTVSVTLTRRKGLEVAAPVMASFSISNATRDKILNSVLGRSSALSADERHGGLEDVFDNLDLGGQSVIDQLADFAFDYRPQDTYNPTEVFKKFLTMVQKEYAHTASEKQKTQRTAVLIIVFLFKNGFSKAIKTDGLETHTANLITALKQIPKSDDDPSMSRIAEFYYWVISRPNLMGDPQISAQINAQTNMVDKGFTTDIHLGPGFEVFGNASGFFTRLGQMIGFQMVVAGRKKAKLPILDLIKSSIRKRTASIKDIVGKGGIPINVNTINNSAALKSTLSENDLNLFYAGLITNPQIKDLFPTIANVYKYIDDDIVNIGL